MDFRDQQVKMGPTKHRLSRVIVWILILVISAHLHSEFSISYILISSPAKIGAIIAGMVAMIIIECLAPLRLLSEFRYVYNDKLWIVNGKTEPKGIPMWIIKLGWASFVIAHHIGHIAGHIVGYITFH